ncbi:MAG: serine/threonine-protein phosphatase [Spirochaetes bacterium]|nr:serine/threonine-protein phosphatase [Spirochaetota bacterium]
MKIKYKKAKDLYTLYGALFGFCFPFFSTVFQCYHAFGDISFTLILEVQKTTPLLWVIDSAPFFLGLFARFAGIRQDRINKSLNFLKIANKRIKKENFKIKKMQAILHEKKLIIEEDLNAAKMFQESLLPEIPDFKHLTINYQYIPVTAVGGDFLTITPFDESSLSILIGDVSGHGVAAALITSLALAFANKIQKAYGYQPQYFLEELNDELLHFIPDNRYLTAIFGYFQKKQSKIYFTFARGGHPYPILWKKNENLVELVKSSGTSIGSLAEGNFEEMVIKLSKGDRIYFYTDGLLESVNGQNEELGFQGLSNIIHETNQHDYTLKKNLDVILYEIKKFCNHKAEKDDIVLVGIEVN